MPSYYVEAYLLQLIPCVKPRSPCHQRDSILALRVPPLLYTWKHIKRIYVTYTHIIYIFCIKLHVGLHLYSQCCKRLRKSWIVFFHWLSTMVVPRLLRCELYLFSRWILDQVTVRLSITAWHFIPSFPLQTWITVGYWWRQWHLPHVHQNGTSSDSRPRPRPIRPRFLVLEVEDSPRGPHPCRYLQHMVRCVFRYAGWGSPEDDDEWWSVILGRADQAPCCRSPQYDVRRWVLVSHSQPCTRLQLFQPKHTVSFSDAVDNENLCSPLMADRNMKYKIIDSISRGLTET